MTDASTPSARRRFDGDGAGPVVADPWSPAAYDFELPTEQIAQTPAPRRGDARMLVLARGDDVEPAHAHARDLLAHVPGDALVVVNDSKVVPARVWGTRDDGRRFELLLVDPAPGLGEGAQVRAWIRNAKKLRPGERLSLSDGACVLELVGPDPVDPRARRLVVRAGDLFAAATGDGEVPLPPYIARPDGPTAEDDQRYQTVFARHPGSVAAPTAGLHLEPQLLEALGDRLCRVTLHVGPGTFLPMEHGDVREHRVGSERISLDADTAARIEAARAAGQPVVAVGTTVVRSLESIALRFDGAVRAFEGSTDLVITPDHRFRVVDGLLTNFHLPRSSLLMLTATFGGRARVLNAYRAAVAAGYRFYSYGDCMLVWRSELTG